MRRVLVGFIIDGRSGGIDKYLLNFLENVWEEDLQIDFLTKEVDPELEQYLKKRDSNIFAIPKLRHPVKQYRQIRRILDNGKYDVVYLNISIAMDFITAWAAKTKRVKRILIHSHSSGNDCESALKRTILNLLHYVCRLFLHRLATEYYGCSKKAGVWMFPKKIVESPQFTTVFNAVDIGRYRYSDNMRQEVRRQLRLEDKFVIGHVGNFTYQKNHDFLIEVFEALHRKSPETVLLLVGTGHRFEVVKRLVEQKGLANSVKMLGQRTDVDCLMQAMDFFLLPSNFEGLPTVGVEAQCAGLPCLMSDIITHETRITDKCWFLPLQETPEVWGDFIWDHRKINRQETLFMGSEEDYSLEALKKQQKKLISKE